MAESEVIQYFIDTLIQLVADHVKLISGVRHEVEQLADDLSYLNAFLKCASRKRLKDELAREHVRQVRDAVYDAEVVVDAFVTQTASFKSMNWLRRPFAAAVKLDEIARNVRKTRKDVERKCGDKRDLDKLLSEIGDHGPDHNLNKVNPVRERNVVSVEDDANKIIGYLKEDTEHPDIITIVGMPGLGKSTLAGYIFRDPSIQDEFPKRIWVNVSKFSPKEVFLSILKEIVDRTEDIAGDESGKRAIEGSQRRRKFSKVVDKVHSMNERILGNKVANDHRVFSTEADKLQSMDEVELGKRVKGHLEDESKFLIVMDDVWMGEDWKSISSALPTTNRRCKILITSRDEEVASANKKRPPFRMRRLSKTESVELLQYEVFGEPRWKPEFGDHGELIAEKCKGLPLAIVVMGGIIRKKFLTIADYAAKVNAWNTFSGRVGDYLVDDSDNIIDRVISLSYDSLPDHLRACFLYFGMFPEDVEIPTWKLFEMWIAEGFVQEKPRFSKDEIAESYLDELIIRSLVTIDKTSFDGKVKAVRIHDTIRAFCLNKAKKDRENFFEEITKVDGNFTPLVNNDRSHRRLSIHSNISQFISSKPHGPRVRSFVCVSEEISELKPIHVSVIPKGFKLLRVLDMKPITYPKLPSNMHDLLHLRYIHLSFDSAILPRSFSKLWNIQTLIVSTTRRTLKIKANIWKMRHLRHLKTNSITTLPKPTNTSNSTQGESNIQTLGKIAPENFTGKVLDRACNLRRVTIRGELNKLLTNTRCSIDNMAKLSKLEELKLENDVFPCRPWDHPLAYFPAPNKFPPKLRTLTLSYTRLNWGQMKVLASLASLKVLKLAYEAFMGNYWETVDGGFRCLQVLFIERTDLIVWKSSAAHFPALVRLELQNCEDLRGVPVDFANIPSFEVLGLNRCPTAVNSAKKIELEKSNSDSSIEFKLTIN